MSYKTTLLRVEKLDLDLLEKKENSGISFKGLIYRFIYIDKSLEVINYLKDSGYKYVNGFPLHDVMCNDTFTEKSFIIIDIVNYSFTIENRIVVEVTGKENYMLEIKPKDFLVYCGVKGDTDDFYTDLQIDAIEQLEKLRDIIDASSPTPYKPRDFFSQKPNSVTQPKVSNGININNNNYTYRDWLNRNSSTGNSYFDWSNKQLLTGGSKWRTYGLDDDPFDDWKI